MKTKGCGVNIALSGDDHAVGTPPRPARNRRFESISLQRRVCKLSRSRSETWRRRIAIFWRCIPTMLREIPPAVKQLTLEKRRGGIGTRLWIEDLAGLLGLVELRVVEIHPWGATVDDIEGPDTLVFDLDPGEGVEWQFVVETAFRLRDMLAAKGHDCWPKTTGGKGLHVMVPISRGMTWDAAHGYTGDIAYRSPQRRLIVMSRRRGRPHRQTLHRLLAQWTRHDRNRRILAARTTGISDLRADDLGPYRARAEVGRVQHP